MQTIMCLSLGYLLGSLNPSVFLSKVTGKNVRKNGSGNPGATNTMVVMGLNYGLIVLFFDMMKTVVADRLAKYLFPQLYFAGLIAACGTVIGHMFPFYLKFQGGKGVACLAGMVMTFDIGLFFLLLSVGITVMFVLNYGIFVAVSVALVFPLLVAWKTESIWLWLLTSAVGWLIVWKHQENFEKIKAGEEIQVRTWFGGRLLREDIRKQQNKGD